MGSVLVSGGQPHPHPKWGGGNAQENLTSATLKDVIASFKVAQGHSNQQRSATYAYDFLLGPILYRFRDKRQFLSKIAIFPSHVFNAHSEGLPSEFCNGGWTRKKTRMMSKCDGMTQHTCVYLGANLRTLTLVLFVTCAVSQLLTLDMFPEDEMTFKCHP